MFYEIETNISYTRALEVVLCFKSDISVKHRQQRAINLLIVAQYAVALIKVVAGVICF